MTYQRPKTSSDYVIEALVDFGAKCSYEQPSVLAIKEQAANVVMVIEHLIDDKISEAQYDRDNPYP